MHNPPHPGEVLKALCLEPLNLTITEAAKSLGVSRRLYRAILNGRAGISPEMAVPVFSLAFDTSAGGGWLDRLRCLICGAQRPRTESGSLPSVRRVADDPENGTVETECYDGRHKNSLLPTAALITVIVCGCDLINPK